MGEFCVVASPPLQVWSKNFCGRNQKKLVRHPQKQKTKGERKNEKQITNFWTGVGGVNIHSFTGKCNKFVRDKTVAFKILRTVRGHLQLRVRANL